ncbi:hypothetical protein BaRGS_00024203 [Batillaria attramentaria]|uniref:Uncharacterized protein n=1 Tax=Batillaria attramentaria TaxID=370345 RepID=A0ABD0KBQ5_9CAEN
MCVQERRGGMGGAGVAGVEGDLCHPGLSPVPALSFFRAQLTDARRDEPKVRAVVPTAPDPGDGRRAGGGERGAGHGEARGPGGGRSRGKEK